LKLTVQMSEKSDNLGLQGGQNVAAEKSKRAEKINILNLLWLFSPLVSFVFIRQQWEARLLAITGSLIIGNTILFYYGLNPYFNFAKGSYFPVGRKIYQQIVQWTFRIATISLAIWMLLFLCAPIVSDCSVCFVHGKSRLLRVEGQIIDNNFNFGMFFLGQDLRISDNYKLDQHYMASYFFTTPKIGKRYKLIIAPRSKMVLDWSEE